MTPYSVTIHRPDIGKRQCCLKAPDAEAARHRVKTRTYPGCTVLSVERRDVDYGLEKSIAIGRQNISKHQATQKVEAARRFNETIRLVAEEGFTTIAQISDHTGFSLSAVAKYVQDAVKQGKLIAVRDWKNYGALTIKAVRS